MTNPNPSNEKLTFHSKDLIRLLMVVLSALIYSSAIQIFTEHANLFPGGFAGISLLFTRSMTQFYGINIPFGVPYFLLNTLAVCVVFKTLGKKFALYSILWYTLTSFFTSVLPVIEITEDLLLISVFGGLMAGTGIGIALRNNASSGGLDFLAVYTSRKLNRSTWNYVLLINAGILVIAGYLFGWDKALYSIIFQFCNTQIVNLLHDRYKLKTLLIVTHKPEEVATALFETCRHGITRINAEGMFSKQDEAILLMTINAFQVSDVTDCIRKVDPHSFVSISQTEKIYGNYYQKPLD